ncbi:F-box protein [Wickerhamomyces ciferrii]|uniref:F-box protein n=1 Tax=Wickerhamomyces ciferrii (strain ATCC 14091 / BCRC 22168 / CBS 111 / JCM 3599 / NBRC 0793 / NRRL Y-1031 F-60-10) TaxID=1206466 RepID=K0KRG1_WICCF|nr:F-box protein [Wickerhamomyces ciferrii]CCH45726.1 F-box protein [Wickerhamomyces ciferrii]
MDISTEQRALEVYEKGVAKESIGSLAFKIHKDVEKLYRQKLHDEYHQDIQQRISTTPNQLLDNIKGLSINDQEDEEQLDPCWILNILTDDILIEIITYLIRKDPSSHVKLSYTCKRLNSLCFSSISYKTLSKLIYPYQQYSSTSQQLNNITTDQELMVQNWDFNWELMLMDRPFIKYHGTYISKVSYISQGAADYSFYAPVKLVTYFRYLRFHPDGTVLKMTTTDEPTIIIPVFNKLNVGKWLSASIARFSLEMDGRVLLESVNESYKFIEELQISNLGDRKFHRLNWINSFTEKKSDGERGYFSLKKEKPFNFSNVKSYTVEY